MHSKALTDQAQRGAGHQSVAGRRFHGALTIWERYPADLARFLVASLVCMAGVALTLAEPEGVQSTSSDLVLLFDQLPNLVTQVVVGILQVAALVAPVGAILYMRRGRWAELALAVAAAVVAGLAAAVLTGALADAVPPQIIADGRQPSWSRVPRFPRARTSRPSRPPSPPSPRCSRSPGAEPPAGLSSRWRSRE